jgi:hypothetical protein
MTLMVGTAGTFAVTTTGFPVPTPLTETGALPNGVTFVDNANGTATLAGTSATGTGGTYALTITAANGVLPNATQTFTLTVHQAPAITSGNAMTLMVGTAGTFTVTRTGFPVPTPLTETGALPNGVTFVDNLNGTATLAGTSATGTVGTYALMITAANGVLPDATQAFTLTVNAATVVVPVAPSAPPVTVPPVPVRAPVPVVTLPVVTLPVLPVPSPLLVPTGGWVAATPKGAGYWSLTPRGILSEHGNARNFGSENNAKLSAPVVAVNSTRTGQGYWLAAANGRVFKFGDAKFFGSLAGRHLNAPIVAISRTSDNRGYLLAGADGGVFAFGDATFEGSLAGKHPHRSITSMVATPDNKGYWLVGNDGGVFTFGDAHFYGSLGAKNRNRHIVGIATTPDGKGYWLVGAHGTVSAFGDAKHFGSSSPVGSRVIVGIIADANIGYRLITAQGKAIAFGTTPRS